MQGDVIHPRRMGRRRWAFSAICLFYRTVPRSDSRFSDNRGGGARREWRSFLRGLRRKGRQHVRLEHSARSARHRAREPPLLVGCEVNAVGHRLRAVLRVANQHGPRPANRGTQLVPGRWQCISWCVNPFAPESSGAHLPLGADPDTRLHRIQCSALLQMVGSAVDAAQARFYRCSEILSTSRAPRHQGGWGHRGSGTQAVSAQ